MRYTPDQCSQEAQESVKPAMSELLVTIHDFIAARGSMGATDEEGQVATGIQGNTWRPCRLKLEKEGLVAYSGTRPTRSGRKAMVWYTFENLPCC